LQSLGGELHQVLTDDEVRPVALHADSHWDPKASVHSLNGTLLVTSVVLRSERRLKTSNSNSASAAQTAGADDGDAWRAWRSPLSVNAIR